MKKLKIPPIRLILITVILSLSGSWHFGYGITSLNTSGSVFHTFLNSTRNSGILKLNSLKSVDHLWTLIVNMISLGCLVGTIFSWWLFERLGRKNSFYWSISINTLGLVICALTKFINRWEMLIIGRFFAGA